MSHASSVTPFSRRGIGLFALCVAGSLACASPSWASDTIATDRPDFVESSLTVGTGRVQVESSIAWESTEDGRGAYSTPVLFRVGIAERWELRLESEGWLHDRGTGEREWADISVGVKYHLEERDGAPSMAWLVHADLATGAGEPVGRGTRPSVRFVAEWELPHGMSMGAMPGVALERDEDGATRTVGLFGVVVGKGVGENGRVFAELAASRMAFNHDGQDEAALNLGGAYLLGADTQLDVAFSHGLTDATADRALTVGLSRRW